MNVDESFLGTFPTIHVENGPIQLDDIEDMRQFRPAPQAVRHAVEAFDTRGTDEFCVAVDIAACSHEPSQLEQQIGTGRVAVRQPIERRPIGRRVSTRSSSGTESTQTISSGCHQSTHRSHSAP